jgi:hypothetical protein
MPRLIASDFFDGLFRQRGNSPIAISQSRFNGAAIEPTQLTGKQHNKDKLSAASVSAKIFIPIVGLHVCA